MPRYVSLKTDRVNLREGPSKDHRTAWVFQRAGLPVEIVAEYETWRRIRDSEGDGGLGAALAPVGTPHGSRHALGQGRGAADRLLDRPDDRAETCGPSPARRDRQVKDCTGTWCRVVIVMDGARDVDGYIRQDKLWGVYPNETVE